MDEERHFIGDLLSNEDDSFAPKSPSNQQPPSSAASPNASSGPVGRPPSSRYWPEPPPPYTESPPHWAALKQPGGAAFAYHPYGFHPAHPPPFAHPPAAFMGAGGHPPLGTPHSPHPHLSQPKMVLAQPATVPSNTFQVHLPAGTVLTPATHMPSGPTHIPSGQWESVYTPFGSQDLRRNPENSPEFANQRSPREKSPEILIAESRGSANLPKAGKSYRDVASAKPPIHPGSTQKRVDSPTLRSPGDHQYRRKHSAGSLVEPNNRQSSSESQSETGGAAARPLVAKAAAVYENYSDSDGDRASSEIYGDTEKLEGILQKGDGNKVEKNLSRKNVTTNTGVSNEFQKIERKKNRRPATPPKLTPASESGTKKESRFDILASSPKNKKNQQPEGMGRNEQFVSGPGFRSVKLNNEGTVEAQYRSKSETRKTAYINNDLTGDEDVEDEEEIEGTDRKTRTGGPSLKDRTGSKRAKRSRADANRKRRNGPLSPVFYWIRVIFWTVANYCQSGARWLIDLITDIGSQLWDIAVHCSRELYTKFIVGVQTAWYRTGEKLRSCLVRIRQRDWLSFRFWRRRKKTVESWGLEENITLPATGEEAMRRLLSCKGQDAYSILGLRADCSEDDIKRYYKRQAVLVHPDKNVAYGAEEAFRILHHAYGMIDKPETRQKYNMGNLHKTKEMQELEELLEKLRQKVEEALSTMHCDCGHKHRRFVTKRTVSEARYCKRCKDYHSAREKNLLKHMKPNSHLVQYRLITGQNRKQNGTGQARPQRCC